jgi:UDP-3-O-[3-hydroxymyristoyl] glucosamine N-acyltransferase
MNNDIAQLVDRKKLSIEGVSYIGEPRSNTVMFITKKVEELLTELENVEGCLVFAEKGMEVSGSLLKSHAFFFSERPQLEYTRFITKIAEERFRKENEIKRVLKQEGYYVTEDVVIPNDAYIEPGCVIGPCVKIGKGARILSGAMIKNASIGDSFYCNQGAVVGSNGFTMVEDECGNLMRIPTLGKVIIGNNVEIGSNNNVSCGSAGDTIICDNVKIDALVNVGHDNYIGKNCEITAGVILGGFVKIGDNVFIGVNSTIRNRVTIGNGVFVSMGSAVMKSIESNCKVVGNPARVFERFD